MPLALASCPPVLSCARGASWSIFPVDSEPRLQTPRAQGPGWKSHGLLGALEALIRKETANDSVSGLWPPCSLYGPFTVLGPGLQTEPPFVREGGAREGPACWLWPTGPTFPRGRPWTPRGWARSGDGHSRPGPDATLPGPSVITLPRSLGSASGSCCALRRKPY